MREEIKKASHFIINSYGGKYGEVSWEDCTDVRMFCINHTDGFTCEWNGHSAICFRGSHGDEDWQDNFTFNKHPMTFGDKTVNVHTGFKTQYYTVWYYLHEIVDNSRPLLVCGHSLGGALASLCAADFATLTPAMPITCVTWGSPRVGGKAWVKLFNELVPDSLRYVYRNDLVTRVPNCLMNYVHIANKIHLDEGGSWIKRITGDKNDHYPQKYFKAIELL